MKKVLLWLWLLTKRLYKKPAFLLLLLLIPALTLGYLGVASQDSGVVTVALAREGDDPLAEAMIRELSGSSQLIRHVLCDTSEEARELVTYGKADCAWIFPEDMAEKLMTFVRDPREKNAVVTVYQREESAMLRMAREQLSGVLYGQMAQSYYLHYIREEFPQITLSDEALLAYYQNTNLTEELFRFEAGGEPQSAPTHYLLTPIRGLLAVGIALCGLAAAMFYQKDLDTGTFSHIPQRKRLLPELASQLVAVGQVGLLTLLTLLLGGLAGSFGTELLVLALHCLCVISFCMLLRQLLGSLRLLACVTPLLVVAMLLVCPVFLDLGSLRPVQYLLPPTYYIHAIYASHWRIAMVIHTLCCAGLSGLLRILGRK